MDGSSRQPFYCLAQASDILADDDVAKTQVVCEITDSLGFELSYPTEQCPINPRMLRCCLTQKDVPDAFDAQMTVSLELIRKPWCTTAHMYHDFSQFANSRDFLERKP